MIVVTTNDLPGYRIQAVLGEVMGITVRSTNIGSSFTASFRAIGGGEIPEYTKIVTQSRQDVMHRMVVDAQNRGANAIIAMRFDTDSIGQFSEVCAYGTAVIAEPIGAGEPGATGQSAQIVAQTQPQAQPQQQQRAPQQPQQQPYPQQYPV